MKNKFCENCRANIAVDETRIRAVAFELSSEFYNTSMSGFWNSSHRVPGRRVLAGVIKRLPLTSPLVDVTPLCPPPSPKHTNRRPSNLG